jgi:hypothetical protein
VGGQSAPPAQQPFKPTPEELVIAIPPLPPPIPPQTLSVFLFSSSANGIEQKTGVSFRFLSFFLFLLLNEHHSVASIK